MATQIDEAIQHLLIVKEEINAFNRIKEQHSKTVAISKSKYEELLYNQCLDNETLYCVLDKEIGQYIDGYMDIQ